MVNEMRKEIEKYEKYLLPSIKSRRFYKEKPLMLTNGEGAILKDIKGNEYIDLFSMNYIMFLGYKHPEILETIKRQVDKLIFSVYEFHTEPQLKLAEKLAKITPSNLRMSYFLNSGSEAVECALMISRQYTKKYEIISLYGSYHGKTTYGARSATGWSKAKRYIGPMLSGFIKIPWYYCYRCIFKMEYPECDLLCAKILEDALKYQGDGSVAAFIVEPILGSAGNIPPPKEYFIEINKILNSNDILFIDDEITAGLGRTGRMFAIEHYNVKPDIMTIGKTLGGGLPISATIVDEKIGESLDSFDYYVTYGGNPLACSVANVVVDLIWNNKLYKRAEKLGNYFIQGLKELSERYPLIGDVRGCGLMIGVELVKDVRTKKPAQEESLYILEKAREKGLILPAGRGWFKNVIRINPPVVITEEQIDKALNIIEELMREACRRFYR